MEKFALENPILQQSDRRGYHRTAIAGDIYFATKRRIYGGTLKNLSSQGLYIETSERFSMGELIFVALPSADIYDLKFRGRIVWCDLNGFGAELEPASLEPNPNSSVFSHH